MSCGNPLLLRLRQYLLRAKKQLNLLVNVDIMIYEPSALNNFALVLHTYSIVKVSPCTCDSNLLCTMKGQNKKEVVVRPQDTKLHRSQSLSLPVCFFVIGLYYVLWYMYLITLRNMRSVYASLVEKTKHNVV